MYRKLGTIVAVGLALSGCATSPFYVDKASSYAPGFIPRNALGEPVFPTDKAKSKAKEASKAEKEAQTASASMPAPKPAKPRSWLN